MRSADGRSRTVQADTNGDGIVDHVETIVVAADGIERRHRHRLQRRRLAVGQTVTTTSANGLSATTQQDRTGAGTFDRDHSDVIAVNADGSRTETVTDTSANGTLLDQTVTTTSADGLSVTTESDYDRQRQFDQIRTDVTVLNADGSKTETVTDHQRDGSLRTAPSPRSAPTG